jgi:hypothetical protein
MKYRAQLTCFTMQCLVTDADELLRTHVYCMALLKETHPPQRCQNEIIGFLVVPVITLVLILVLLVIGLTRGLEQAKLENEKRV